MIKHPYEWRSDQGHRMGVDMPQHSEQIYWAMMQQWGEMTWYTAECYDQSGAITSAHTLINSSTHRPQAVTTGGFELQRLPLTRTTH